MLGVDIRVIMFALTVVDGGRFMAERYWLFMHFVHRTTLYAPVNETCRVIKSPLFLGVPFN